MLSKANKIFNKLLTSKRRSHIIKILEQFDTEHMKLGRNIPLDLHIRKYYLQNRTVTVPDREFINNQVYNLIRYKGLLDFLSKPPLNWHSRLEAIYDPDFELQLENQNLPAYM
jgi:hypothetical protein